MSVCWNRFLRSVCRPRFRSWIRGPLCRRRGLVFFSATLSVPEQTPEGMGAATAPAEGMVVDGESHCGGMFVSMVQYVCPAGVPLAVPTGVESSYRARAVVTVCSTAESARLALRGDLHAFAGADVWWGAEDMRSFPLVSASVRAGRVVDVLPQVENQGLCGVMHFLDFYCIPYNFGWCPYCIPDLMAHPVTGPLDFYMQTSLGRRMGRDRYKRYFIKDITDPMFLYTARRFAFVGEYDHGCEVYL